MGPGKKWHCSQLEIQAGQLLGLDTSRWHSEATGIRGLLPREEAPQGAVSLALALLFTAPLGRVSRPQGLPASWHAVEAKLGPKTGFPDLRWPEDNSVLMTPGILVLDGTI